MGLAFGCNIAAMFLTIALSLASFLFLFNWSSMSSTFVHRSLKLLKHLSHQGCGQVVPKIIEAHAYQLLLVNFCGQLLLSSRHLVMKLVAFSVPFVSFQ